MEAHTRPFPQSTPASYSACWLNWDARRSPGTARHFEFRSGRVSSISSSTPGPSPIGDELLSTVNAIVASSLPSFRVGLVTAVFRGDSCIDHLATVRTERHRSIETPVIHVLTLALHHELLPDREPCILSIASITSCRPSHPFHPFHPCRACHHHHHHRRRPASSQASRRSPPRW